MGKKTDQKVKEEECIEPSKENARKALEVYRSLNMELTADPTEEANRVWLKGFLHAVVSRLPSAESLVRDKQRRANAVKRAKAATAE